MNKKVLVTVILFGSLTVSGIVSAQSVYPLSLIHICKCGEYNLMVAIHDEYRPTGFSRTYPNPVSYTHLISFHFIGRKFVVGFLWR